MSRLLQNINLGNLFFSFLSISIGIFSLVEKRIIPTFQNQAVIIYIGNYAYFVGLIAISIGLYILYYEYKKLKTKTK
jgi:hypothetical protein